MTPISSQGFLLTGRPERATEGDVYARRVLPKHDESAWPRGQKASAKSHAIGQHSGGNVSLITTGRTMRTCKPSGAEQTESSRQKTCTMRGSGGAESVGYAGTTQRRLTTSARSTNRLAAPTPLTISAQSARTATINGRIGGMGPTLQSAKPRCSSKSRSF